MRSPLKEKPLRNPGESLALQIREFVDENALIYMFGTMFLVLSTIWEWYRSVSEIPPRPWTLTIVTAACLIYTVYKVAVTKRKLKFMKQGLDAEKFVGQFLNNLPIAGIRVFHDIPGKGFNLDHVVMSSSGIFVIETKAPSKPLKGQTIITFDGSVIDVNGFKTDAPLIQVRAATGWLKDLLKSGTGKDFAVQPVIVYPDWYVVETAPPRRGIPRVVNQQFLPGLLGSSYLVLEESEVAMAADHLARYVRNAT